MGVLGAHVGATVGVSDVCVDVLGVLGVLVGVPVGVSVKAAVGVPAVSVDVLWYTRYTCKSSRKVSLRYGFVMNGSNDVMT